MSHHLSDEDLERYRRREMAPGELLAADDHLCGCDSCYGRFGGGVALKTAYNFAGRLLDGHAVSVSHLTYDEQVAYVEGKLSISDQESKQVHLEACPQCQMDVGDLASIRSSLTPRRKFSARQSRGAIGRIAVHWRSPAIRASVQFASIVLLIAVGVRLATNPMRSELTRAIALIQQERESNAMMEENLARLSESNAALHQELQASKAGSHKLESSVQDRTLATRDSRPVAAPWIPLSLADGSKTVALDKQGKLSGLESLSPAEERLVKDALTRGYLTTPSVMAKLSGPPPLVMGEDTGSESYPLRNPVAMIIESSTPTFQWRPVNGATGYVVGVYDDQFKEVAISQRITATEWTVSRPLKQGVIYTWQVKAFKDGDTIKLPRGDQPDAKFKVLDRSTASRIERARNKHAGSHLMLAVLYAEAGLLSDAERELEQLAKANPTSVIASQLLLQVKSVRPK